MMELKDDRRFHNLTQEQVETLDQVLTEVIPIHGRGNFPTLKIKPKDIIHVVRDRLVSKNIKVRDVRLNGSTASHVLVKENGTSYKDLDIIFGVEIPKQEDFQIIKEVVLGCLLDFLPQGVNKDKITALTMKEAYVQKMVKVFTEYDRWSLISLSNNSGKNVELKFVSSLRRQFEFSVDSFQIILDTMLESYLESERREAAQLMRKEPEAFRIQSTDLQSGILHEQITSAGTENCNKTDITMSGETKDTNTLHDVCHNDEVMMKDQYKFPVEETTLETIYKEEYKKFSETMTKVMEDASELSESRPVHMNKLDERNQNQFMQKSKTLETHSNQNILNTQLKSEQVVTEKNKNIQHNIQLSDSQACVNVEGYKASENIAAYSGTVKSVSKKENTNTVAEPMQTTEKNIKAMVLSEQSAFQHSSLRQHKTEDSNNEFSLPPPAKKTSQTSQMVVLKHSSPKPPRKMSRKVTCVPHLASKLVLKDSTSKSSKHVGHQLCTSVLNSGTDPKESAQMQVELAEHATSSLESISSSSRDKDTVLRILDISTTAFSISTQENGTHSEEMFSISSSPQKNAQTHIETSEPETGETTNHSILSPKPFSVQKDQNMTIQPFSEITCQPLRPVIHINCQPIVEIEDSLSVYPNSSCKEDIELATQTAECAQRFSEFQETSQTVGDSSKLGTLLPTNLAVHSGQVETSDHGFGVISSPVSELSISCLLSQEQDVPGIQPLESSKLTSHHLEPPILISQKSQDSSVLEKDFSKSPEISSCLLEPPILMSKNDMYSVWSSNVLESSTCLEEAKTSAALIQTSEPPKVLSQIVEPSVELPQPVYPSISQAEVLKAYIELELMTPGETPEGSNLPVSTSTESPLPSPREIPSVTVVAESMYGDFEQAMDHLRYKLIATRNPEEIRGGGLLKYSNLLVRDFKPASETEIKTLERYMCSRFFIDFPDVNEQQRKIESYLRNHFIGEEKSKYDYLMTLRRVVNESTVCLMGHERRQTLNMITILALKVLGEQNIIPNTNNVTCYYQPAPYMADHNFNNYYIANGQSPIIYHPYPLHIHMQTGLV